MLISEKRAEQILPGSGGRVLEGWGGGGTNMYTHVSKCKT
jgi:hypothetical protein